MKRALFLLYGTSCYILFLLVFLYLIGFAGNLSLPTTVDRPAATLVGAAAWIVNIALLCLFGIQHSVMARKGFKAWLTRWMTPSIERSSYVLLSSVAFILLFAFWQPLPGVVWNATATWAVQLLWAVFAFGWLLTLLSSFAVDHFDLLGLRQVWLRALGRVYTPPRFKNNIFYRLVRHPLMTGFLIGFWATPHMTVSHLLLAVGFSAYIFVGLQFEERDLLATYGADYERYRHRVPKLCPWPRPRAGAADSER